MKLLEDLIRCYGAQARERSIQISLKPEPTGFRAPVEACSDQILRLFTNLLLNALRHRPAAHGGSDGHGTGNPQPRP